MRTDFIKPYLLSITTIILLLISLNTDAQSKGVSVAISDNLLVLDKRKRSGTIELINLSADPTEFSVSVLSVENSELDGSKLIRWSPKRALASAHKTLPFRVAARPPKELPIGEYLIHVGVRAERQVPPPLDPNTVITDESEQGIAVMIPIVPVLPITIYYRHGIQTPMLDIAPLVQTPDDVGFIGYFPVRKLQPQYSFVGTVQIIEKKSNIVINRGRLHLRQGTVASDVKMPRGKQVMLDTGIYCIQVWDHFPSKGQPNAEVCAD